MSTKIIAIAGGSGSGKSTFALKILDTLGAANCAILAQDHYYHDQSHHFDGDGGKVNFDHPESLDFDLLEKHIQALCRGDSIEVPIYDFATHERQRSTQHFETRPLIIVEGTLLLTQKSLLPYFDLSYFIDTPESVRFERRLKRDTLERGRSAEGVKKQFEAQVKPMHDMFVEPSKKFASHVIKNQEENDSLELIKKLLKDAKN